MNNRYLIYSASEQGYWSNDFGWCDRYDATEFTQDEYEVFSLPMSAEGDAQWVIA